jgi:hypothetical protein
MKIIVGLLLLVNEKCVNQSVLMSPFFLLFSSSLSPLFFNYLFSSRHFCIKGRLQANQREFSSMIPFSSVLLSSINNLSSYITILFWHLSIYCMTHIEVEGF